MKFKLLLAVVGGLLALPTFGIEPRMEVRGHFIGFHTQLATGIPEAYISTEGCPFTAAATELREALQNSTPANSKDYTRDNVRIELVFPEGSTYFIDYLGVVRQGTRYWRVNTEAIAATIRPSPQCESRIEGVRRWPVNP